MSDDVISLRANLTKSRLKDVEASFSREVDADEAGLIGTHTTIYVTGSAGRGDMGPKSDLDPYVVRLHGTATDEQADGIEHTLKTVLTKLNLPDLDADGKYARLVQGSTLFDKLGSPDDDESGALNRRMLLLLESQPLINAPVYEELLREIVEAYWKNSDLHPNTYLPIVLVNDIVRYWRIVLLNHESRLRRKLEKVRFDKDKELALRRYSSYKLRIPRCLSCFSVLAYLLALTPENDSHVSRDDVVKMVKMSPLQRLESLQEFPQTPEHLVGELRQLYIGFLERTSIGKKLLIETLEDDAVEAKAVSKDGARFTELMFELVQTLGGGRALHRAIVV